MLRKSIYSTRRLNNPPINPTLEILNLLDQINQNLVTLIDHSVRARANQLPFVAREQAPNR